MKANETVKPHLLAKRPLRCTVRFAIFTAAGALPPFAKSPGGGGVKMGSYSVSEANASGRSRAASATHAPPMECARAASVKSAPCEPENTVGG